MDINLEDKIKEAAVKIFDACGIKADIEVTESKELENKNYTVDVRSDDSSILIGYHGETLSSIEHILNLILFKTSGSWQNIRVDISDYKKERKNKLLEIADNAVNKAKFLKKSIALLPMNNFERKIIHEHIANHYPDMTSFSEGESYNRRVIIAAKDDTVETETENNTEAE